MKKIVVIASTNGSVLSKIISRPIVRDSISCIVSDRNCGAIDLAKVHGINNVILPAKTGSDFSDLLVNYFKDQNVDLFVSFYTRLFAGDFLSLNKFKLINLHPSILPACPGRDGFGDTIKSGCKFIGSTIHCVDAGIDTGRPIIQAAAPYNNNLSLEANRHRVFVQQCKMLIQIIVWLNEDRLVLDGSGFVKGVNYEFSEYSPNLEALEAQEFVVPFIAKTITKPDHSASLDKSSP